MRTLLVTLFVLFSGATLHAQCSETKLLASDGDELDRFGYGIALEGDRLLVPAKHDEYPLVDQGTAYVFEWDGTSWVEDVKISASDAQAGDLFGWATAMDGDAVLLGAVFHDGALADTGAAYLFEKTGGSWLETKKFEASDGATTDYFGRAVALDGDLALVGAPLDDDGGSESGSAYVYERVGGVWSEVQKLTASDAAAGDRFGWNLHLQGDRAVIGAQWNDALGTDVGAAYVFDRAGGTFVETQKLQPGDVTGEFGWCVRMGGDIIAVGAPSDATFGTRSGAAYVFELAGGVWSETAKLLADDAETQDRFGTVLAVDGTRVLVGSFLDDDAGASSGSVYLYERRASGWERSAKWVASDGQPNDFFGRYVDLDGDRAAVSAIHDDDLGTDAGSAYVYELPVAFSAYCFCASGPCGNDDAFGGCATSGGAGARLAACGSASVTADDLVLTATGLPPSQFGLLFMGAGKSGVPFGDGALCVASAGVGLFRYPVMNAGAAGVIEIGPGIVAYSGASFPASGLITAGSQWHFQSWFRDPGGPCGGGFNLSHGMSVAFGL